MKRSDKSKGVFTRGWHLVSGNELPEGRRKYCSDACIRAKGNRPRSDAAAWELSPEWAARRAWIVEKYGVGRAKADA